MQKAFAGGHCWLVGSVLIFFFNRSLGSDSEAVKWGDIKFLI